MTKGTWVCFDCRLAQRHPTWKLVAKVRPDVIGSVGPIRCSKCHGLCSFLGPTIELPPKDNQKAWLRLRSLVAKKRFAIHDELKRKQVRHRHDLERRLRTLEDRPKTVARDRL